MNNIIKYWARLVNESYDDRIDDTDKDIRRIKEARKGKPKLDDSDTSSNTTDEHSKLEGSVSVFSKLDDEMWNEICKNGENLLSLTNIRIGGCMFGFYFTVDGGNRLYWITFSPRINNKGKYNIADDSTRWVISYTKKFDKQTIMDALINNKFINRNKMSPEKFKEQTGIDYYELMNTAFFKSTIEKFCDQFAEKYETIESEIRNNKDIDRGDKDAVIRELRLYDRDAISDIGKVVGMPTSGDHTEWGKNIPHIVQKYF